PVRSIHVAFVCYVTSHQSPNLTSTPPAPPSLYTLSLHDALPICRRGAARVRLRLRDERRARRGRSRARLLARHRPRRARRSSRRDRKEHTSELQSRSDLVCRLLLEKKKKIKNTKIKQLTVKIKNR